MDENATEPRQDAELTGQNPFTRVPIEITISVGKAHPTVRELLQLGPEAVLPLDKSIEEPVDLFVSGRLIARGVLEELDGDQKGQLAVRLTEIADLQSEL